MQVNPWKKMLLFSGDMSGPSQVVLQQHGFNVCDLGLFQNSNVCDEVTPANVENGAKTAPIKALAEIDVTAVGDPILEP